MESFIIAGEEKPIFTPEIIMNPDTGECSIKGESYLEEPFKLYDDVMAWIRSYVAEKQSPLKLEVDLTYINSTSSRAILDLFRGIAELKKQGHDIEVQWKYPQGDEDFNEIKEEGEEFIEESGLDIQLVSY